VSYDWDAADYRANSSMQWNMATEFISRLDLRGDERVLDVGCGDGKVTAALASRLPGGSVTGLDRSAAMIELATREHPTVSFVCADAAAMGFEARFDVVASFTALHLMVDSQPAVLQGIRRALVPGGRFVAQFPAEGNCADLLAVAHEVTTRPPWNPWFDGFRFPWLFPGPDRYGRLVEAAGMEIRRLEVVARDVVHAGAAGLAGWMRTTWMPYWDRVPAASRSTLIAEIVEDYAARFPPDDAGRLHVPSLRLEVDAVAPAV
jgi:trans-aconitate methyltransferase